MCLFMCMSKAVQWPLIMKYATIQFFFPCRVTEMTHVLQLVFNKREKKQFSCSHNRYFFFLSFASWFHRFVFMYLHIYYYFFCSYVFIHVPFIGCQINWKWYESEHEKIDKIHCDCLFLRLLDFCKFISSF